MLSRRSSSLRVGKYLFPAFLAIASIVPVALPTANAQSSDATGVNGATKRPNVLMIAIDDLNHWVGHLGRNPQAKTPNLDRLAKMGTTFTNAACAAPSCNPSRAALMSGIRPNMSGVYDNSHDWRQVIPKEKTLTTQFLQAG